MKTLIIALKLFLMVTIITGLVYPLLMSGIAQIFFPEKANGSIILRNDQAIGSKLIGQQFGTEKYFVSRPSATGYSALPSGGSNYGLTNTNLKRQADDRR